MINKTSFKLKKIQKNQLIYCEKNMLSVAFTDL